MQDNPSARLYTVQIYVHFQVVGLRIFFKKEFIYYVTNPVPKKQCKSVIFHYSLGRKKKNIKIRHPKEGHIHLASHQPSLSAQHTIWWPTLVKPFWGSAGARGNVKRSVLREYSLTQRVLEWKLRM
jgi:hypothetical protein